MNVRKSRLRVAQDRRHEPQIKKDVRRRNGR